MQVGRLRTFGLAKEPSVGTITVPPTEFLRFIPPDSFYPKIPPLISKAVGSLSDVVLKQTQGPGTLNGMKLKMEVEPENIGHILQALYGLDTKTGPTNSTVYTHTFQRQNVAQLPTYTFWFDKQPLYPQFLGCMLNKAEWSIKAKELVLVDTEWEGLTYDTTGVTHAATYSGVRPFAFNMATVTIDGSSILNYDNLKLSFNNMVKADHALSGSIYPAKIYSEGFEVDLSADLFFEDATQYNKFLTDAVAHFNIAITHVDTIAGSSPATGYSLTFDMPTVVYETANLPIPAGILKISFTGKAIYSAGSGYSCNATLANSVSTTY